MPQERPRGSDRRRRRRLSRLQPQEKKGEEEEDRRRVETDQPNQPNAAAATHLFFSPFVFAFFFSLSLSWWVAVFGGERNGRGFRERRRRRSE